MQRRAWLEQFRKANEKRPAEIRLAVFLLSFFKPSSALQAVPARSYRLV